MRPAGVRGAEGAHAARPGAGRPRRSALWCGRSCWAPRMRRCRRRRPRSRPRLRRSRRSPCRRRRRRRSIAAPRWRRRRAAAAAVAAAEAQPRSGGGADGSGRPAASAEAPPRGATAPAQPTRQRSIFAPPQCAPALAAVEARAGRRAGRTWSRFRERLHRHRPAAGQVDTSLCTGGARLPAVASTQVGPREGCLSPAPASRACLLACCRCQPADWRLARDGLEPRLLERPLAPYPAAVDNGAARVEPGAGRAAAPPPGLRLPLKSGGTDGLGSEDGAAAGAAPCGSCDRRFWSCPGSAGFKARRPRAGRACPAACSPRAEAEQRLWTESDVSVRASRDVGRPAERRSLSWQEGSLGRAACDPVAPPSRGGKLRRCLAAGT